MAPPLIVRAILDTAQYFKAAEGVNTANAGMGASALTMGTDFTKSSAQVVAAGVKVAESLQVQVDEYGRLAAAAKAGSLEQQIAAVQGAKAQASLNRMLGVTATASSKVASEAKKGEHSLGKLSRGALAGSGLFSKLGRSLAFASAGFIAVAGGATVVAESIRQAEGLAAAQRQVDRQLKTSGKSWDQYGGAIDKTLLKEGHLAGFTRSQLLQAFGYLLRVGGNVSNSLKLTGLAADVARGRSISLQAASIALSKALGGSVTALRRLGIVVPNNVTKMKALEYVQAKFAGQAAAGTTESDRLSASLVDAGATIGTVLLPTFDRLASGIAEWLTKMQESGKLAKDVSAVTTFLGHGFHLLGSAIATVDKITGSFGKTLLFVGEAYAAIKIVSWISQLRAVAIEWGLIASAAEKAAAAEAAAAAVSAAGIATGDLRAAALAQGAVRPGLLTRLGGVGIVGRAGIGAGLAIGGQILGPQIGGLIGGQAGRTTSSAIQFAGLGAGIGLLAGPEGAAAGAAVGALVGGLRTLIHTGPSVQSVLEGDAASMKSLATAAHQAALDVTDARLQRLQLQATLAGQKQAVSTARSAVDRTAPGTAARVAAVRQLNEAELTLRQTEEQLKVTNDSLARAQEKQDKIRAARKQVAADERDRVLKLAASYASLERALSKGAVTSSKDIDTLMQSVKDGTDKASNATDSFVQKLTGMAAKSSPGLREILNQIIDLTVALHHVPSRKEIEIIFKQQGDFRVGPGGEFAPNFRRGPGGGGGPQTTGPAPPVVWTGFNLTIKEQIAQVQAGMTKTLADDVKIAKEIIARIRHLIDVGHIVPGTKAYLAALQEQANAESVLQSAEQQKAERRKAAAQKALQLASTYNTPIDLQIAQVQAEMTKSNKDDIRVLKKIIAAAKKVLASGAKNKQGRLAVLETILQAQQALQSLLGTGQDAPLVPLKLQLALAKAEALGTNQTGILLKMRAALYKALKAARGNIQKQIDIWNQIAGINSQLQSSVTNAYGAYKKASVKALTANLNLTAAQRRELEARLARVGPGGTTPSSGIGAAGYIIDPTTGRPMKVKKGQGHTSRGNRRTISSAGGGGMTWNETITINLNIDGKQITRVVTTHQQGHRKRNPPSRRGPHAATPSA